MIEVESLRKSYGGRRVVDDVSFVVPAGQVTGFVGPNGAGKSTVLRAITGLMRPDGGRVVIDGLTLREHDAPGRVLGSFVSAAHLPDRATARGALHYVCDVLQVGRGATEDTLTLVGLLDVADRRIGTFSMGMRQRLGIAAAVISQPRALMLDEPLNGLDPDGVQWLRTYLRSLASGGTAVLLSSHVMSELAQTADRIVMLDQGRVVAQGALDEFVAGSAREQIFVEAADAEIARGALRAHCLEFVEQGGGFLVDGPARSVGRLVYQAGTDVIRLHPITRTLEETYFDHLATNEEQG